MYVYIYVYIYIYIAHIHAVVFYVKFGGKYSNHYFHMDN